jgi:hypothetical protein
VHKDTSTVFILIEKNGNSLMTEKQAIAHILSEQYLIYCL